MVKIYPFILFFSVFLIGGLQAQVPVMNPITGASVVCTPPSSVPVYTAPLLLLRISPRFDDPKLNLADIYIQEKNWGKADTCLQTMFKDSERHSQYQKMVDAFKPR